MGIRLSRRFTKFVCLIFFTVAAIKFYKSIKVIYEEYKNEKEIRSKSFMLPFNIRRDSFYTIKPAYTPPLENKDIVINIKGKEIVLEEIVNAIRKENKTAVPVTITEAAITLSQSAVTKESEEIKVKNEDKNQNIENIIIESQNNKKGESVKKEIKEEDGKSYYIQLGIYKDKKNAEKIVSKISDYKATLSEDSVKGQKIYRVSIEGFEDRESAMAAADKMRKVTEGDLPIVRVRY